MHLVLVHSKYFYKQKPNFSCNRSTEGQKYLKRSIAGNALKEVKNADISHPLKIPRKCIDDQVLFSHEFFRTNKKGCCIVV